ncbi:acetylglutamate kinase [Halobacteriales archaeon SW_12_71_31]|nr:MAG: acetylglutamate kinase [Halobacteriales archaeon SW_12_71_31]
MIVLKLGGSVITDKSTPETVDEPALERAATALSAAREREVVVVHGAGSFGHHHAAAHGVTPTEGTHDPEALWEVHDAMRRLNDRVTGAFRAAGLAPAPVHPFSLGHRDAAGELTLPTRGIATTLAEGFVPVLHGDGVVHRDRGVTILSGDELVVRLARDLGADRVGFCSTVPGVLRDGAVIERIDAMSEVSDVLGGAEGVDVTGGMAGKVDSLLGLGAPGRIFGPDALAAFLDGEPVGTLVDGRED